MKNLINNRGEVKPQILFFDIEVTPHIGYFWGHVYETSIIEVIKYGKILCFAAKWLGEKTFSYGWPDFKRNKERNVIKKLRDLLDQADLVIGHNGKQFDVKWFNTRLLYYHIPLPSPYRISDTKTEAKKYLKTPSNRLNDLSEYYGLGRKLEHEGFPLWKKCMDGDKAAWDKMLRYCRQDVELDARFYDVIKPFVEIKQIYYGNCSHCGSENTSSRGLTINKRKRRVVCKDCYGWSAIPIHPQKCYNNK